MPTRTLTVVSALALCTLAARPETPVHNGPLAVACANTIAHEPVVLYEVTGGTLTGPVDAFLAVYNDGSARYSGSTCAGFSQSVFVGPAAAAALRYELISAGALEQCDQPDLTNDVPQSTLTVLRGTSSQRATSFSWFTADGDVGAIEAVLADFIGTHFAPPPGGPCGS